MSIEVSPQVVVRRERTEVAAYMFDPAHDLEWTGGITASRPAQPGLLRTGVRVERTARFLGRSFSYEYVVTAHEPGHMVELAVERPFPMTIRYEPADHPESTLVIIHAAGEPGLFFRWATLLLRRQVRRRSALSQPRLCPRTFAGRVSAWANRGDLRLAAGRLPHGRRSWRVFRGSSDCVVVLREASRRTTAQVVGLSAATPGGVAGRVFRRSMTPGTGCASICAE
ncbi:hypothetical protein [Nonomuraea jabiensis]|uniref:hypothetical protein n=1 Tax=Nonomuraea jabiensis TaxID=882448 RepID=UPI003D756948